MMKSLKNITVTIIVTSLVAGPMFVVLPTKAEAGVTDCIAGLTASLFGSKATVITATGEGTAAKASAEGEAVAGSIMAVPTSDAGLKALMRANTTAITALIKADANINSKTASDSKGLSIKRCIIEPLVTIMAKALLDNFTAQTIRWINSGFQGNPLYVTNLKGFLSDVADQAVGSYIEGLGPIGQILCSPFDLQLRLSLGIQYSQPAFYQQIGCRLSDIQQNVNRAFTSGVFGENGWDNWISITASPQNNPYGAYLKAVDSIDARIAGSQFTLKTQLDFGDGFLSSTDPVTGKINTPGSLIEDQLSETLGQPVRNVGLAKDIDAIIGALVGQMINQVMGGVGGLLGAGGSSSGGESALDRANRQTVSRIVEQNRQAQILPVGLHMETGFNQDGSVIRIGPTGVGGPTPVDFCNQFANNIYGSNAQPGVPTSLTSLVYVKVNGATTNRTATPIPTSNATGGVWTVADYNNVALFCQNVDVTTAINDGVEGFDQMPGDITGDLSGTPGAEEGNNEPALPPPVTDFENRNTSAGSYNAGRDFSNSIKLNNNQNLSGLKVRLRLKQDNGESLSLYTLLDSFTLEFKKVPSDEALDSFIFSINDLRNLAPVYGDISLSPVDSLEIKQAGHLRNNITPGANYNLTTEIFTPASNMYPEQIISTQTTSVSIQ